ncbi:MAG: hypothetical protein U1F59_09085 [Candidatus Competibacteraceae bacterium]
MSPALNPPPLIEPNSFSRISPIRPCWSDLGDPGAGYAAGHVPGAVHLDYADLVRVEPPAMGLLPDEARA